MNPDTTTPKNRRRWIAPTAAGAVALILGIGIGAAGGTETTATQPTPTATVTAEPEVVTETVEVDTTPEACLTALDAGEELLTVSLEGLSIAAEYIDFIPRAFDAGMNYDVAASEQIIAEMDEKTAQLGAIDDGGALRSAYDAAAAECRGA